MALIYGSRGCASGVANTSAPPEQPSPASRYCPVVALYLAPRVFQPVDIWLGDKVGVVDLAEVNVAQGNWASVGRCDQVTYRIWARVLPAATEAGGPAGLANGAAAHGSIMPLQRHLRSLSASRPATLAAFWPHKSAQRCHLLPMAERHRTR
jgi:hypothetical protein